MRINAKIFLFVSLSFCTAAFAAPKPTLPASDVSGTKEPANLARFSGSVLLSREYFDYDEIDVPLTNLKRDPANGRDANNNAKFIPDQSKTLSGQHTRLIYVTPANTTPLQAIRNYQNDAKSKNGKVLFECKSDVCGGSNTGAYTGGGGNQSMAKYLWPQKKITAPYDSLIWCAQDGKLSDMGYTLLEQPAQNRFLSVISYQFSENHCPDFINRTFVVVDVVQSGNMNQTMATISSNDIESSIKNQGHIAIYGINFDSGKSDVKPESADSLAQIAKALKEQPALKLIVAGHTDNDGSFDANLALSKARAEAVVNELATKYGVAKSRLRPVGLSFASPLSTNKTPEGKAQNRRVELVEE